MPYNEQQQQQPMMDVRGLPSVCTAALLRPAANVHYVGSDRYTTDPAQTDVGYGAVQMSSAFITSTGSREPDAARNVGHSFGAVCPGSHPTRLRQDYIYSYSPLSGSTPAVYEAAGLQGSSHLPAHGWSSPAVPVSSVPRFPHISSTSWQDVCQQADIESAITAGTVNSMAASVTGSCSPLTYSAVSSIASPLSSSTSAVPSPALSPYSPSVGKTFTEASGSEGSQLPLHVQQQYLENLLQLHYLLLASNKLQAPTYPPTHNAHRFNTYIPGTVPSVTRPTTFDVNHVSLLPGFAAPRFPR